MKNITTIHPLQTAEWASFREKWGNEVLKTSYGYLTLHKLPFLNKKIGIFEKGEMPTSQMLKDLVEVGKKNNLIFIKLEPNYVIKKDNIRCSDEKRVIKLLKSFGAVRGKTIFTPTTFWIDLTKPLDELLKGFKSKTRYNIRLSERHGVKVYEDNSEKAFEQYLKLTTETVARDKFFAHNEKYHRLMWNELKGKIAHLLVSEYKNEILTTWILFSYDGFLYYPYGASSSKYKNVMANNLMMWEAIKFGKKHKLKVFDLWGREPGRGFTPFKEGYNPEVVEFLGTWDLVINRPMYYIYKSSDFLRWLILRGKVSLGITKPRF